MSSTRDNPGAFNPTKVRSLRSLVSHAFKLAKRGSYQRALKSFGVDAANLFEHRIGAVLPKHRRCSCCGHEGHQFRHVLSGDRIAWNSACPGCGSRSRHRGLAILLPRLLERHRPDTVLHFAAEPVLRRCFSVRSLRYETADLNLEDSTHTGVDLQHLPFADESYDFIVCNHVLEHLPDDVAAIREIARVLTKSGVAVITVPGDFTRQQTVRFEGELPNGHYRDYGTDFLLQLRPHFVSVRSIDMHQFDHDEPRWSYAIRRNDLAFVCERTSG